jgi:hypothetical protein
VSKACRFTQCLGLGAAATPNALVCDPATGRYALAEAVNVEVRGGRLVRRPGRTRLGETGYASLFSDGATLYGVAGDGLFCVPGQGEPRLLRQGLTEAPMAFVAVGGTVYFANGFESGLIRDGAALPWGGGTYPGPDRFGRFGPPPAGQLLAFFAGRIWIAAGSLVHFTEGAGLYDWVDATAGFLPPCAGRVRLLRAVSDGLLIGDDAGVTFAAGFDPKAMTFARVCPVAPIPGSDAPLLSGRHDAVAGRELAGDGAIWAGSDGVYLGLPGGGVTRLAAGRFPAVARAAAVAGRDRYLLFFNDQA